MEFVLWSISSLSLSLSPSLQFILYIISSLVASSCHLLFFIVRWCLMTTWQLCVHILLHHFPIPVGWGCRSVRTSPNECPWYDTKPYIKALILELWGICSTPSFSLFPAPLLPEVVVLVRVPSMGQIIIIIIIMSRYQHGYPWPSLANPPYCPLLPAGL